MKIRSLVRFWGILGALALTLPCEAATINITGANTPYDAATMAGNTLSIASGASLVTNSTTGLVPDSCVITGTGGWIANNDGNVYYDATFPSVSGFTGTIYVGNVKGRWMPGPGFYQALPAAATIDVTKDGQVWLQGGTTVNANLNLHDPGNCYDGLGLLRFDGANSTIAGGITLNGTSSYTLCVRTDHNTTTGTISGSISGTGNLVADSKSTHFGTHSTLKLTGLNTYSGTTTVKEGTLELSGNGTLGAGAVTVNANNGTFTDVDPKHAGTYKRDDGLLRFNKTSDYTLSQTLSGTGFVEQVGSGNLTLSGSLSGFTGTFTQKAGTVTFAGSASAFGTGSTYVYAGGTLANSNAAPIGVTTLNVQTGNYDYDSWNAFTETFNSANRVLGTGSKLTVATAEQVAGTLGNGLEVAGGTFVYSGSANDAYVITADRTYSASETISVPAYLANSAGTTTLTVAGSMTETFSHSLTGAGQNLIKDGAGTLVIGSSSNGGGTPAALFTGTTTIKAGTLEIYGAAIRTDAPSQVAGTRASSTPSLFNVEAGATVKFYDQYQWTPDPPRTNGVENYDNSKGYYNAYLPFTGAGTVHFATSERREVSNLTNPNGFTGTIKLTGPMRLRNANFAQFAGCTLDASEGAQVWTGGTGDFACALKLANGTSNTYDLRGALRFDVTAGNFKGEGQTSSIPNFTGSVTLTGNAQISTIQGDAVGVGMISGNIGGNFALTKNEGHAVASNPLNARLVLTGTNTYGATSVATGTLQLGHVGTVNGKAYTGNSGTLGTGKLTVADVAAFDYCRTDATGYDFKGGVANAGQVNLKSGFFKTSGEAVSNTGSWSIASGATYESASNFTGGVDAATHSGTITNAGTLNVTGGTFVSYGALNYSGAINVRNGARLNVYYDTKGTGSGIINVEKDSFLGIAQSADAFSGKVNLTSEGTLTLKNHVLTRDAVFTGDGTIAITIDTGVAVSKFANVDDFEGLITLDSTGTQSRLMLTSQNINLGEKATFKVTETGQIYLAGSTLTGNLQLKNSTGFQGDTSYRAGIRADSGNSYLYGTLELLDPETAIAVRKDIGCKLYVYSNVSGDGGLLVRDDLNSSSLYLAGNTAYAGSTKVAGGTLVIGDGTARARMQACGTVNLAAGTALNLSKNGTLSVGTDADVAGRTLAFTGAGNASLAGTIEISVFSGDDYDKIDFTGLTGTVNASDATVFLDMEHAELNESEIYSFEWAQGLNGVNFADVLLSDRYSDWSATIGPNGLVTLGSPTALPEPASWLLMLLGFGFLLRKWRKA